MISKEKKGILIVTSVIILLPMIIGLMLWNRLPDSMAVHFGMDTAPNGWSSKPFTVLGMPGILLALHWLGLFVTDRDNRNKNNSEKMLGLMYWIIPCISVLVCGLTYAYALGARMDIGRIVMIFLGLLFVIVGNFLPKCQPNRTVGIRIPWTLADPENWRRTHRLGGWTLCIGGVLEAMLGIFSLTWPALVVLFGAILVPIVYSGIYHSTHK